MVTINTTNKILAKILALRLVQVLPSVIHSDQCGYLQGRYIGDNIRTVADVIEYTRFKNMPGILLLLDFEKAFDTVSWSFIHKTLNAFNFGNTLRKWIQVMYNEISSTVTNNGHSSQFFMLSRGIRQGCPLSAYLFILVAEVLAIKIRKDENIKGIEIGERTYKILQLADDTTCFFERHPISTEGNSCSRVLLSMFWSKTKCTKDKS